MNNIVIGDYTEARLIDTHTGEVVLDMNPTRTVCKNHVSLTIITLETMLTQGDINYDEYKAISHALEIIRSTTPVEPYGVSYLADDIEGYCPQCDSIVRRDVNEKCHFCKRDLIW